MSRKRRRSTGPPKNLASGIVKALRPRQWVKNLLVFAAPVAALGDDRYAYDYREVLVNVLVAFVVFSLGGVVRSTWSTTRATSRPTGSTRPSASARSRRAWCPQWLAYTLAVVLARGLAGDLLAGDAEPGAGDGDLHRHPAGLLLRAQAPGRHRHLHRLVGLPDPGDRRRRGRRCAAVAMVPADDGLRVAVHGGRKALRRTAVGRTHRRQDPQVAGELHQQLPALRLDAVGHRRWCSATGCGPSSATTSAAPPGSWCR